MDLECERNGVGRVEWDGCFKWVWMGSFEVKERNNLNIVETRPSNQRHNLKI
jgi:hypothetical protein